MRMWMNSKIITIRNESTCLIEWARHPTKSNVRVILVSNELSEELRPLITEQGMRITPKWTEVQLQEIGLGPPAYGGLFLKEQK